MPWRSVAGIVDPLVGGVSEVLGGLPAEGVLDRLLRAHRQWNADERRVAAEALFGVGLWRRRLAHEAGLGEWSAPNARVLLAALVGRLGGVPAQDVSGWLNVAPLPDAEESADLAVRHSFPEWIVQHAWAAFGDGAEAFLASLNVPGPVTLRANALRCTREELVERLRSEGIETTPGQWSADALHVVGRANILGAKAHQDGWFEVQDEGSQLLGALVEARSGATVLDLCAGAGGKTLQLAAQLGNEGVLYAYDVDRERLRRLEKRAARAGITCVRILWEGLPDDLKVDRVLVDAPCSELGVLRRGPDLRWRLAPEIVPQSAALQRELLQTAVTHARPGARIVYATCTFTADENERVVRAFSDRLSPSELPPGPLTSPDGFLRTAPHLHGTDAFFGAVLLR